MLKPNRSGFDALRQIDLKGSPFVWSHNDSTSLQNGITSAVHYLSLPFVARKIIITKIFSGYSIIHNITNKCTTFPFAVYMNLVTVNMAQAIGLIEDQSIITIPELTMGLIDPLSISWNVKPGVPGLEIYVNAHSSLGPVTDWQFNSRLLIQGTYYL